MRAPAHDPSDRIYRLLLRLFPLAFRERFGADMAELFRDRRQAAWRRAGWPALVLVWARTIADVLTQAAAAHVDARRRQAAAVRHTRARLAALPPATHRRDTLMGSFISDFRQAFKNLVRRPAFLAVAVLTLALGIGANAAIFTVVHAVLIEPLPYPEPERLVFLSESDRKGDMIGVSMPNFLDWRARSRVIDQASVWFGQSINLTGRGEPDRVRGAFVSSDFFPMLGLTSHLGRVLGPEDDKLGAARVVVLAYESWQRRFAGERDIIGRTLILNNDAYTVVGVASPGFWFPYEASELWLSGQYITSPVMMRGNRAFLSIGRLKPGVGVEQARAELGAVGRTLAREYPQENAERGVAIVPMQEMIVRDLRASLLMLLGAVGFVLLIACVNLANLQLARGASRHRELAVRAALGATRRRLFAQLLTESLALGAIGGVAGLTLAAWAVPALLSQAPPQVGMSDITLGWPVVAFTLGLSVLTGLIFGTLPAVRLSRADLQSRLRDGTRAGEGRGSQRVRSALVVAEVALSLMLLVGAGLLTRSLILLLDESPGFQGADRVLSLEYRLPSNKYTAPADQWRFHEQVVERVRQVPGVTSASLVRGLAFSGNGGGSTTFTLPDMRGSSAATEYTARANLITSAYFETMGIPVLRGRSCGVEDQTNAPLAVVINQQLAERAWPKGNPIGARLAIKDPAATGTIVGVVGNTKHGRLSEPIGAQIYTCYSQRPTIFATLVARTAVEPMSLERAVKAAIWSIDRDQPVWKVRTVASLVDANLAPRRYEMWLMVGTALVALMLAIVGIYGVMSYMVTQRTREIGVRMALGASRPAIARLIVGRALLLTGAGLVLGLIGARAIARALSSMLFGITASDALTYTGVAVLLMVVALLASYIPARRAMRVNPVSALRTD